MRLFSSLSFKQVGHSDKSFILGRSDKEPPLVLFTPKNIFTHIDSGT